VILNADNEVLITPGRIFTPPIGWGADFVEDRIAEINDVRTKYYGSYYPITTLDSYTPAELSGTAFYNTFYFADATGRPRFYFSPDEHIYLKDNRVIQLREHYQQLEAIRNQQPHWKWRHALGSA